MNLVIFDIDGTLTRTNAGDEYCFAQTVKSFFGIPNVSTNWFDYTHSTDSGIIDELVRKHRGKSPSEDELEDFRNLFVQNLHLYYSERPDAFSHVPGADRIFNRIHSDFPEWKIGISTGAWKASALLKLGRAGLYRGDIPASFADEHFSRDDIIRSTIQKSSIHYGADTFEKVVYVGDGRWDFVSSQRLGIGFVGIADDREPSYLSSIGATHIVPHYEDFSAFMQAVEETPSAAATSNSAPQTTPARS